MITLAFKAVISYAAHLYPLHAVTGRVGSLFFFQIARILSLPLWLSQSNGCLYIIGMCGLTIGSVYSESPTVGYIHVGRRATARCHELQHAENASE